MKSNIRVFIVEDALFLREMLCRVFADTQSIEVVGMTSSVRTAVSQIQELKPDLVLLDLVLPKENGIVLIGKIAELCPETEVIVCSSLLREKQILAQSEMAGAMYFIKKPFSSSEIVDMIISTVKQEEMAA